MLSAWSYNYYLMAYFSYDFYRLRDGEIKSDNPDFAKVNNHQIFASKYFTYLPTEEELKRELRLDEFQKLDE